MGPRLKKLHAAGDEVIAACQAVYDAYVRCGLTGRGTADDGMRDIRRVIDRNIRQKLVFESPQFPTPPGLDREGHQAVQRAKAACSAFNRAADERVTPYTIIRPEGYLGGEGPLDTWLTYETED